MDDLGGILGSDDFLESNTFQLDELVNELLKDDELETVKGNDSSSDDGYNGSISPPNSSPSQVFTQLFFGSIFRHFLKTKIFLKNCQR